VNNLLTGDSKYARPLLSVWQPDSLCKQLPTPLLKELDHNVYVRSVEKTSTPLILWSPASGEQCQVGFESAKNLQEMFPQFSANSPSYVGYNGPLFKSATLGNYQLLPTAPGASSGVQLPAEIRKLLGLSAKDGQYVGAYPPKR
jgi:hypothetical protein